jgi:hypothetical protein
MDCSKIRKIKINIIGSDGAITESNIFFNVETGLQISEKDAAKCTNIQPIDIQCATLCIPVEPVIIENCWQLPDETCWLLPDGGVWLLP